MKATWGSDQASWGTPLFSWAGIPAGDFRGKAVSANSGPGAVLADAPYGQSTVQIGSAQAVTATE